MRLRNPLLASAAVALSLLGASFAAPQEVAPAADPCGHDHALDADPAADEDALLQLRTVTHLNCGWTALYWVHVPGTTFLVCQNAWCQQPFSVHVPF